MRDSIQELSTKFFSLMSVAIDSVEVDAEDTERNIYRVTIKTPDSKLLIGVHGQTLDLTTHLLSRMIEKQHQKTVVVHLEINDYLKSKDERLYRYIDTKIAEAIQSGEEIILSSLTGYERKKVHAYIADKNNAGLRVWSSGDNSARVMHLKHEKQPAEARIQELTEEGIGI